MKENPDRKKEGIRWEAAEDKENIVAKKIRGSSSKRLYLINPVFKGLSSISIIMILAIKTKEILARNYMFKVNKGNTRIRHEICSKLTIKTPERHFFKV